jgi:hypothetical protein
MLGEHGHEGHCLCSFRVLDDMQSLALDDGHARVGHARVNQTYKIVNIA